MPTYKRDPETNEWLLKSDWNARFPKGYTDTGFTIINKSFDAFESHASGKIISNHAERREDMAREGCIEYDPEMRKDYQRNIEQGEREMDKKVDEVVEREFAAMSTADKENVAKEMATTKEEYTRIDV